MGTDNLQEILTHHCTDECKGRPCPADEQDDMFALFDQALTACNRILAPLTRRFEVGEITERLIQHITTHMDTELCAIANGPDDDSWHELSEANQQIHYELPEEDK